MDLSKMDLVEAASEASPMPLLDPHTGEETGIVFLVLGYDSQPVTEAGRKFASRLMARRKKLDPTEVVRMRQIALAKAAVVGLEEGSDPLEFQGEEIKVPSKQFNDLLDKPGFIFIAQQIERHGDDRGNYSPEAPKD